MLRGGPMDGECFRVWVEEMLAPVLEPGDIVVVDNLHAHKVAGALGVGTAPVFSNNVNVRRHRERQQGVEQRAWLGDSSAGQLRPSGAIVTGPERCT
jgi:hypothetical protein